MANIIKTDNSVKKRFARKEHKRKTRGVGCRILIVCEGEKTEPKYFEAFEKKPRVVPIERLDIDGGGINTLGVVDRAIILRDQAKQPYDSVWAVFDKDSFSPNRFNAAINKAKANNISCAWSNEAFELWYLLHFHDRNTAMYRNEYKKQISLAINSSKTYKGQKKYAYDKGSSDNYVIMNTHGSQEDAIRRAKKQMESFETEKYHTHNPCTCVYLLVEQLIGRDEEFNEKIKKLVEE